MKISCLSSDLKYLNRIGSTLSPEQRLSLQSNAIKLSHQYTQYEIFYFWGRVEGISRNYYVIQGVTYKGETNFPKRKYFWSNDDFKFAELADPRLEYVDRVKEMGEFFSGQHEKILVKTQGQAPKFIRGPDGQQLIVKQKNFTELDRLSILVHLISQSCSVVPLGAYRMIPTHQIIQNPDFRGLKVNTARLPQNYIHLRAPQSPQKKILIESDKALETPNFMDSLDADPIKGSWSIQADQSGTQITIRSLLWPGYVAYHRTNSDVYGGVYVGNGVMVRDLMFLL